MIQYSIYFSKGRGGGSRGEIVPIVRREPAHGFWPHSSWRKAAESQEVWAELCAQRAGCQHWKTRWWGARECLTPTGTIPGEKTGDELKKGVTSPCPAYTRSPNPDTQGGWRDKGLLWDIPSSKAGAHTQTWPHEQSSLLWWESREVEWAALSPAFPK